MINDVNDRPEIDFLILADRAEGINGKLYLMGGGWQNIALRSWETGAQFAIALGIIVPWNATNEDHEVVINIDDEDGNAVPDGTTRVRLQMGRPAGVRPGRSFRAIVAINHLLKLPHEGTYRVIARVGEKTKEVSFEANSLSQQTA